MPIQSIGVKNLSQDTIKKIRRMIAAVKAEPEFYNQNTFGENICKDEGDEVCGTVCCAAGWAVWAENKTLYNKLMKNELENAETGYDGKSTDWLTPACKALGLTYSANDSEEASYIEYNLFGAAASWPSPYDEQYEKAKTPKQRALVFEKRWENFIKNDGSIYL